MINSKVWYVFVAVIAPLIAVAKITGVPVGDDAVLILLMCWGLGYLAEIAEKK